MLQAWSYVFTCSCVCIDPLDLRQKQGNKKKCNQGSKHKKRYDQSHAYYMTESDKLEQIISTVLSYLLDQVLGGLRPETWCGANISSYWGGT